MSKYNHIHLAKMNKKDEFYTQINDIIAQILDHLDIKKQFENKIVYMNCDNPELSNFVLFFKKYFHTLKLKKIITTHLSLENEQSYKIEWEGEKENNKEINIKKTPLKGNGDFRSDECIEILRECDIVVTNPPFSLFREYMLLLNEHKKKFLIIGNQNAITSKDIFPLIKENKVWFSYGFKGAATHFINQHYEDYATAGNHKEGMIRVSGVVWYTNLKIEKQKEQLLLTKTYLGNEQEYPKYDNYDAIEINKIENIPKDYNGIMGVPITFLDKYNPEQFEIIGLSSKNNCGLVKRLHPNEYYNGYTRGKVITRIESNMPILNIPNKGGTKCTRENSPDLYQIYWRIFIKKKSTYL